MAKIGISNVHYAIMSTEDTASANPVYGTVKKPSCGLISVDVNVNSNKVDLYADNILWETESAFQNAELTADIADFPLEMQSDLLGNTYDSTAKTLIKNADDVIPYVALGFEFLMSGGKKMAVWMYKGKFAPVSMSGQTKGENTEYGTNEMSSTFSALKGGGANKGRWQYCQEFDSSESTDTFFATIPLATVTP